MFHRQRFHLAQPLFQFLVYFPLEHPGNYQQILWRRHLGRKPMSKVWKAMALAMVGGDKTIGKLSMAMVPWKNNITIPSLENMTIEQSLLWPLTSGLRSSTRPPSSHDGEDHDCVQTLIIMWWKSQAIGSNNLNAWEMGQGRDLAADAQYCARCIQGML